VRPGIAGPLFTNFAYENLGTPRNLANPFYRMSDVEANGEAINPLGFDWIDPGLGGLLEKLAADPDWRNQPFVPRSMFELSPEQLTDLAKSSRGQHKVPTLRNVARVPFPSFGKSYTHNGYFKTLAGLVHFYNTRDVLPACDDVVPEAVALASGCWPPPEVAENINHDDMGDLGLSATDEIAVVAFLSTLSDE
jgi:cytochrome c peroxidase